MSDFKYVLGSKVDNYLAFFDGKHSRAGDRCSPSDQGAIHEYSFP